MSTYYTFYDYTMCDWFIYISDLGYRCGYSVLFNWVTDFNLFGFKFLQSVKALVEDFIEGNHRYKGAHVFFTEGTVYHGA